MNVIKASSDAPVNPAVSKTPGILDTFVKQAADASGWAAKHGKPALNTGIRPSIQFIKKNQPMFLQPQLVAQVVPQLPGLMGGYPQDTVREHGANIFLCIMFGLLGFGSLFIFFNNASRKHWFWWNFGLFAFCACKVIGFATRYVFGQDITNVNMGIVSVVFIHTPQLLLCSMNHMLAHRIFTWKHPETGNSWWLNAFFDVIYFFVIGIIIMAIIGQAMPFARILTPHGKTVCQNVTMAAAILNLVYALMPFQLLATAYMFKSGALTATPWKRPALDRVLPPVYQANWIKSVNPFYYVPRNTNHAIYKDEPVAKDIRIMSSSDVPAGGLHDTLDGVPSHANGPCMLGNILIVSLGSLIILLNTCFRVAAIFANYNGHHVTAIIETPVTIPAHYKIPFFPYRPECVFAFYGGLEGFLVLIYLLSRVDLRFYIPDMAKRAGANPHPYEASHGGSNVGTNSALTPTVETKRSI